MPVYLAHGFRWPRDGYTGIRVHTIVHNLETVSSEYIQNVHSRAGLLSSLRKLYPDVMAALEKPPSCCIDFLEQYDPDDVSEDAVSQPYAFVCDRIVMIAGGQNAEAHASQLLQGGGGTDRVSSPSSSAAAAAATAASPGARAASTSSSAGGSDSAATTSSPKKKKKERRQRTLPMSIAPPFTEPSAHISALSLSVEEVTSEGSGVIRPEAWAALAELRDNLADGERIGWWVIFNGDPERAFEPHDDDDHDHDDAEERESKTQKDQQQTGLRSDSIPSSQTTVVPVTGSLPIRPSPQSPAQTTKSGHPSSSSSLSSSSAAQHPRSPSSGRVPPPVPPLPAAADPQSRVQQQQQQQQQQQRTQRQLSSSLVSDRPDSSSPPSSAPGQRQGSSGGRSRTGRSSKSSSQSKGKGHNHVQGLKKLFGRKG